ncbi:hypothetical protein BDW22DRAFT_969825 [Trametopsis cervina]|nr:hypothetical protein BDW22DRAFT_969825 [Trametopsis cervina]
MPVSSHLLHFPHPVGSIPCSWYVQQPIQSVYMVTCARYESKCFCEGSPRDQFCCPLRFYLTLCNSERCFPVPRLPLLCLSTMDSNTLIHIGSMLVASWCAYVACTPPNPAPSEDEKSKFTTERQKTDTMFVPIAFLAGLAQTFIHTNNVTEALAILANGLQLTALLSLFPQRVLDDGSLTLWHPERIVGLVLMIAGTSIRIDCYRRLQKNFTFQLALKEDHKLVTDGSYAYVRHPSYTGALLVSIGALMLNYGRGSFWAEHALQNQGLWMWLGLFDIALKYVFFSGAVGRCKVEDDVLKAHFEDEWVRWAQKTKYRMVPFLY